MHDFESIAHQVGTEQRHAAARDAATALAKAAGPAALDPGHDITRMETVLAFAQGDVADQIMRAAGCGHTEHVLAAAVMLVSELSLRLATAQRALDSRK